MDIVNFFWNLSQDARIRKAERGVDDENMAQRHRSRQPSPEFQRMALLIRAMWELLAERTGVTQEELAQKIAEIDRRDGVTDDRLQLGPIECPSCRRLTVRGRPQCVYCGAEVPCDPLDRI